VALEPLEALEAAAAVEVAELQLQRLATSQAALEALAGLRCSLSSGLDEPKERLTMEKTETQAQPGTVAAGPPQCSKCDAPATSNVHWPWGETYPVCAMHQGLAQQTGENIGRSCSFSPIAIAAEEPLTRSERARLKGEVYAAEAEIADLKQRGLNLYNENVALTRQLQSQSTTLREAQLQLKDAKGDLLAAHELLEERGAEVANITDEVLRLRTLTKFSEPVKTEEELHRVGLGG
jgi:regulator of replication initiation timing